MGRLFVRACAGWCGIYAPGERSLEWVDDQPSNEATRPRPRPVTVSLFGKERFLVLRFEPFASQQ